MKHGEGKDASFVKTRMTRPQYQALFQMYTEKNNLEEKLHESMETVHFHMTKN